MPASVIPVTGLALGPVGKISQTDFPLTTPRQLNPTDTYGANFGDPVVLNANNTYSTVAQFVHNGGTLTSTTPLAVAQENVRSNGYYPLTGGTAMPGGVYTPGSVMDALTRGTINVAVNSGTPQAGGPVYVRVVLNNSIPAGVIGGFEAAVDPTTASDTILITNMVFKTGVLSADGTAQLTMLNRSMA